MREPPVSTGVKKSANNAAPTSAAPAHTARIGSAWRTAKVNSSMPAPVAASGTGPSRPSPLFAIPSTRITIVVSTSATAPNPAASIGRMGPNTASTDSARPHSSTTTSAIDERSLLFENSRKSRMLNAAITGHCRRNSARNGLSCQSSRLGRPRR